GLPLSLPYRPPQSRANDWSCGRLGPRERRATKELFQIMEYGWWRRSRALLAGLVTAVVLLGTSPEPGRTEDGGTPGAPGPLALTHGIASGDVTSSSAVIWARASDRAQLHVEYDTDPSFSHPRSQPGGTAGAETDFTASAKLDRLQAG